MKKKSILEWSNLDNASDLKRKSKQDECRVTLCRREEEEDRSVSFSPSSNADQSFCKSILDLRRMKARR